MKTLNLLARPRIYLIASFVGATLLYFVLALIYELESIIAGKPSALQIGGGVFIADTFSQHWLSLMVWLGVLLLVVRWRVGLLESIRTSQELVNQILETAADGIYFVNRNGRMTMVNAAVERMLGATRAEICQTTYNHPAWKMTTLDGRPFPEEEQPFVRVLETGAPVYGVEQCLERVDGKRLTVSINAAPLRNAFGQIIGEVGTLTDITERKRAEQALCESEAKFRTLSEQSLAGITIIQDGRIKYTNQATADINGHSVDEMLGWEQVPFEKLIHPEDLEFAATQARKKQAGDPDSVPHYSYRILMPDGATRWVDQYSKTVEFEGRPADFVVLIDITERKRAEAATRESEERYKNIVENANDIIYRTDANGRFEFYNSTALRLLGYSGEELIGRHYLDLIHPAQRKETRHFYRSQLASGTPSTYREVCVIAKDGNALWLGQHVQTLTEQDRLAGFQAVARDITERKRAEQALCQAEEKYRGIFENAVVGIYQTSLEGKWLTANSALARTLGYDSPSDLIARMSDLNQEFYVDPNRRMEFVRQMQERDMVWGFESEVYRQDRSIVWISENARTLRNVDGAQIGFEGTTIDITDRKQVERLKSEFVSVVSHELRTPLTSIRGSLGLISGGVAGAVSPQAKALVDIAHKNSERLVLLINDILDMEKIESGKMVFDNHPLELMPLLEQAVEANLGYAEQYGVKLSLQNRLPGVQVNADSGRLTQVVTNLISNAVKFSPRAGEVELAIVRRKANVRVSVSDHGSGIPEEFQSRIFQKFAQADSSDRRQRGGTGLGLNICKAIIEKLGGRIGFETQANVGTTFFFDLPEWREETATPLPAAPVRVLVCEDDRDTAKLLQLLLEQAGYGSDLAYDAAQAKAMLKENCYTAMTLDLMLPDQDGISLIHDLRQQAETRDLPVIVVSVKAEQGNFTLNGDAVQVIDWISKPIDSTRLIGAVRCAAAQVSKQAHILHIEDDLDLLQIAAVMLQDVAQVDRALSLSEARRRLRQQHYDLAILDLEMPDGSGLELVPMLQEQSPPVPIVVFSIQELSKEAAAKVSAALVKSRTSNDKLVETIRSLIQARGHILSEV